MISPSAARRVCWCSRRAFARMSSMPMSRGVVDEQRRRVVARSARVAARASTCARPSARPLRRSSPLIVACDAMKRCASSASDISRLNSATGRGVLLLQRDVLGDVGDQRATSHRRPRGQDDQVAGLEAAGDLVEVGEARGRAGQRAALARELLPSSRSRRRGPRRPCGSPSGGRRGRPRGSPRSACSTRSRGARCGRRPRSGSRRSWRAAGAGARARGRSARSAAALPTDGHRAGERVDPGLAAGLSSLPRERRCSVTVSDVDRLALAVQREHRLVDQPVAVAVEVLGPQALLDDEPVDRAVRQQDGAEHGLLGLERVRRRGADRRGLSVAVGRHCAHRQRR